MISLKLRFKYSSFILLFLETCVFIVLGLCPQPQKKKKLKFIACTADI